MWSPGPLLPGLQVFKLNAGGSMQQLVPAGCQVPQKTNTGSYAAKYAATTTAAAAAGPAGGTQRPATPQLCAPAAAASRIPTAPDTTCSTANASGSSNRPPSPSSTSAGAASAQAVPAGRSIGVVPSCPQLARSLSLNRRRTSGSYSRSSSISRASQQTTDPVPAGAASSTGACGGVSSSGVAPAAKGQASCCLPLAAVRAMQVGTTDFVCESFSTNSSNGRTTPGPCSDMHIRGQQQLLQSPPLLPLPQQQHPQQQQQQQQQQQHKPVQLPPPKWPASPSILAGCSAVAAARGSQRTKQPPSSSSSSSTYSSSSSNTYSSSSEPSPGLTPAPQLLQYLQLPPSVKAMLALPQSHSQHKYRERQRLELYALNTVMARSELLRRQQQQQGSV